MLIVFLTLALSMFVMATVLVALFIDVAFAEPSPAPAQAARFWRPPLLRGRALMDWMTTAAETLTNGCLQKKPRAETVVELAAMVQSGVSIAIDQPLQCVNPMTRVGCPAYARSLIAVTPPEAMRVADYIRNYIPQEVGPVHDRAQDNLNRTSGMDRNQYRAAATRCPLMADDNACLAYSVRPLRCRGGADLPCESNTVSSCGACGRPAGSIDAHEFESRAQLVTQGVEQGFAQALKSKGLDGNLYDFNSALATALEAPNAAERWIHGDSIFQQCRPCQ